MSGRQVWGWCRTRVIGCPTLRRTGQHFYPLSSCPTFWLVLQGIHFSKIWLLLQCIKRLGLLFYFVFYSPKKVRFIMPYPSPKSHKLCWFDWIWWGEKHKEKKGGGGQGRVICIHPSWNPKSATKQKSSEIKENTSIYKDYCIRWQPKFDQNWVM